MEQAGVKLLETVEVAKYDHEHLDGCQCAGPSETVQRVLLDGLDVTDDPATIAKLKEQNQWPL